MPNPQKPWLRLWDCTLDLPKAQRLTGEQFKGWINLLMLANRQNDRGRLPDLPEIAFSLRLNESRVMPLIDVLVNAKLVDRNGSDLIIHDWQAWQTTEKTNADRAREWRERQEQEALELSAQSSAQQALTPSAPEKNKNREEKNREEKKKTARDAEFVLPDWIPLETWGEFILVRKRKRAATTPYAHRLVIKTLLQLQSEGNDPVAVINQSIRSGWADVFPLRDSPKPRNGKHHEVYMPTPEQIAAMNSVCPEIALEADE